MNDITPRDPSETSVLAWTTKIAAALTLLGTLIGGLLASVQGVQWFTSNLPALVSGLTALIGGGVASALAVRRMRIDKAAKPTLCIALAMLLQGCVATRVEIPTSTTPVRISRLAFLNSVEIPKVSFVPSTGEIAIEGYSSDGGSAAISSATEAAARGAVQGMKGGQ